MTIFSELAKSVENMGPAFGCHEWKIGRSVTKTNQRWFYAAWLSTPFILPWILLLFGEMVLENISRSRNLNHSVRFLTSVNFPFVMLLLVAGCSLFSHESLWLARWLSSSLQNDAFIWAILFYLAMWQLGLHENNMETKNWHEINKSPSCVKQLDWG